MVLIIISSMINDVEHFSCVFWLLYFLKHVFKSIIEFIVFLSFKFFLNKLRIQVLF